MYAPEMYEKVIYYPDVHVINLVSGFLFLVFIPTSAFIPGGGMA